jgi:hypothetical protein
MEELVDDKTFINEEAMQLMKFHGSYMQVCGFRARSRSRGALVAPQHWWSARLGRMLGAPQASQCRQDVCGAASETAAQRWQHIAQVGSGMRLEQVSKVSE